MTSKVMVDDGDSVHAPPIPDDNADFALIKCVGRLVIDVIVKCWMLSAFAIFAIFLVYCVYGGWPSFCLLSFAVSGVVYQAGDWILYHPEQPAHSRLYVPSPHNFGLPFENLFIRTKDGVRINCVFIPQPSTADVPTIVYLHGNAGNIGHRLVNAKEMYQHLGCNVMLVEYRGYGHSDGSPSEDGLYLDVQAAIDQLLTRSDVDHSKIIVFGRSLGGAVAIDLVSRSEYAPTVLALVLENTFTSIPDMARVFFNSPLIRLMPQWFYKNQFLSANKIRRISTPTLFISGLSDRLIPPRMMHELYTCSGSLMKGLIRFESGTHNETWQSDGYYQALALFIDKMIIARSQPKFATTTTTTTTRLPRSGIDDADHTVLQIPATIA